MVLPAITLSQGEIVAARTDSDTLGGHNMLEKRCTEAARAAVIDLAAFSHTSEPSAEQMADARKVYVINRKTFDWQDLFMSVILGLGAQDSWVVIAKNEAECQKAVELGAAEVRNFTGLDFFDFWSGVGIPLCAKAIADIEDDSMIGAIDDILSTGMLTSGKRAQDMAILATINIQLYDHFFDEIADGADGVAGHFVQKITDQIKRDDFSTAEFNRMLDDGTKILNNAIIAEYQRIAEH